MWYYPHDISWYHYTIFWHGVSYATHPQSPSVFLWAAVPRIHLLLAGALGAALALTPTLFCEQRCPVLSLWAAILHSHVLLTVAFQGCHAALASLTRGGCLVHDHVLWTNHSDINDVVISGRRHDDAEHWSIIVCPDNVCAYHFVG